MTMISFRLNADDLARGKADVLLPAAQAATKGKIGRENIFAGNIKT